MARTFAIGDIHGALRALEQLTDNIRPQTDDHFVFLGDYVDGWSQSAQTISWLMAFEKKHRCTFIKGNHDFWCENWLAGEPADPVWLYHGGQATVNSYASLSPMEKTAHLQFFQRMRFYYIDDENRLYVHAGFSSMHGPEKERVPGNVMWDRTLWEMALAMDERIHQDSKLYPKRLKHFNEIYIGHTPTVNYDEVRPMHACNIWNVDTGAAFYGPLSAIEVHTKTVFQSEPPQLLYPGERGRNP
ncbi:metallophosphoesterase family protein [Chitinophaga lutea]